MTTKHFLTGATLLSGLLLLNAPLFAAVESDIVGYTTIEMQAGKWYQVGTPFMPLEEGATSVKLNEFLVDGFADGDTVSIYLPDEGRYESYSWRNSGTDRAGWYFGRSSTLADVDIPSGQAVFVHKGETSGVTYFSGKVSANEITTFGSEGGNAWDQIVCVYPQTKKLNDLFWTGIEDDDTVSIYLPDEGRYETYSWRHSGTDRAGWYFGRSSTLADVDVPAGQAFFVNKQSQGFGQLSVQ